MSNLPGSTDFKASQPDTEIDNQILGEKPSTIDHHSRAATNRSRFSRLRAVHTIDNVADRPVGPLPWNTAEKRPRCMSYAPGTPLILDRDLHTNDDTKRTEDKAVMIGWLHKTTRHRTTKTRGHRQHRRFRLTAHALEYDQLFQKAKRFPLTSIIDIIYNEYNNPLVFKLVFQNSELILEAPNQQNCIQWVEHIKKEWERWNIACKQFNVLLRTDENATNPETEAYLKKHPDYFEIAKRYLEFIVPGLVTSPGVAEKYFTNISMINEDSVTHPRHKILQRFQSRVGLAPRVQRSSNEKKLFSGGKNDCTLLNKCNFVMIKYPRKGRSMPHDRAFKMDFENLLIMWHQTEDSKFSYLRTLMTEHIVDVREGQNSIGFDRWPFDELEDQSLSVLIEGEKQTVPGGKNYAVLQSLDLICESPEEHKLWYHTLRKFISPKFHLYSSRYESVDPTILLITHWSILTDNTEIREDAALSFGSNLVPHITHSRMQELLARAHQCQLQESEHHGHSLHWDGFIFFFNLLCGIDESNCLLLKLFQEYAKTYPSLGMTVEEFQKFLLEYQHWLPEDATNEKCVQLMLHYDYHYRAYKMHTAKSTPVEFYISLCLLSFGGFLSFLRSPDNSIIDRKHEGVYQDMTQPLSHYFINSSHNTYLEGHQLTGRSTTDAYVRALLQGCRCLEIDCWDGPNGEPRVTHGNTLVSDLLLEEVIKTINKYAFVVSTCPLILSLENHCSPDQQVRMAEIFMNIFGDKLAKKNLVELNDLDRLPSPHQLQGKIILKGTEPSTAKSPGRLPLMLLKKLSLTSTKQHSNEEIINSTSTLKKLKSSEISVTSDIKNIFQYPAVYELNDFLKLPPEDNGDKNNIDDDDDVNGDQNNWSEKLSDLIVYCRTKYIRPWSWDEQRETSVCNMFSFNESSALSRCKDTSKMLACTERQLVRTYPAGTRIDSSNYDPIPLWNHGIQMVALNIQTPENYMFLNQGKFRQNGGCGYVLKPKVMIDPSGTEYTPNMDEPIEEITPVDLEITPLSGQHLMVFSKKTVSMEIQYETYGIPHDREKKKLIIYSRETNPLWPQFQNASPLEKTIYMPELCLVLFAVYIRVSRKLQAGTKQILLGQNVFPLESLKPGLHFIPLRKPGGASDSHIGLFVKISLSNLNPNQASSFGICSEKDFKHTLPLRWSSKYFETCPSSPDKEIEDAQASVVKEQHNKCKENTTTTTTTTITSSISSDAADDNNADLLHKRSRMIRQKAVMQCTAEIHTNSFTDDTI